MSKPRVTFEEVMSFTANVSHDPALHLEECRALYNLCVTVPKNGTVIEIGCELGRSSSIIAQVGTEIGYKSIHIDPFDEVPENAERWIKMMKTTGHRFTLMCMTSAQAKHTYMKAALVYIDGNHYPEAVTNDCEMAIWNLSVGGILAAHDYGPECTWEVKHTIDKIIGPPRWSLVGVYDRLGVWKRC